MSIFRSFKDYKSEIELVCIQNSAVECDLYSIIATLIRESEQGTSISLRDVSTRRTTNDSKRLKGDAGFPDFVVLSREKKRDASIYGCVEAKAFYDKLDNNKNVEQLKGHIKSYNRVIYTNGLIWRLYEGNIDMLKREVILGEYNNGTIDWADCSKWFALLEMLDTINWNEDDITEFHE